jgi:hypothetical protein
MPCRIGPNAEVEQGVIGGQPSRGFEEGNISFEQDKHRMHTPSHRVLLYNIYFMFIIVYLHVGV